MLKNLTIFLLFASCSLSAEYDYSSTVNELVVNGILSPQKHISVTITRPNTYPDSGHLYENVQNAQVKIIEDGSLLGTMAYDSLTNAYTILHYPQALSVYELQVLVDGYEPIRAQTRIPAGFEIEVCNYGNNRTFTNTAVKIALSSLENDQSYWVHFVSRYQQPNNQHDTFLIKEEAIFYLYSSDLIFDTFNSGIDEGKIAYDQYLRINDLAADSITFEVYSQETNKWFSQNKIENLSNDEDLIAVVFKASPEIDKYWKSIYINYLNKNFEDPNPFYEPISHYSNIKNATGIFGGINTVRVSALNKKCNN